MVAVYEVLSRAAGEGGVALSGFENDGWSSGCSPFGEPEGRGGTWRCLGYHHFPLARSAELDTAGLVVEQNAS